MNVPACSQRTLQRDIESSSILIGSEIQVFDFLHLKCLHTCVTYSCFLQTSMIREASNSDPDVWWWVKGDGVDVVKGLMIQYRGFGQGMLILMMVHLMSCSGSTKKCLEKQLKYSWVRGGTKLQYVKILLLPWGI